MEDPNAPTNIGDPHECGTDQPYRGHDVSKGKTAFCAKCGKPVDYKRFVTVLVADPYGLGLTKMVSPGQAINWEKEFKRVHGRRPRRSDYKSVL